MKIKNNNIIETNSNAYTEPNLRYICVIDRKQNEPVCCFPWNKTIKELEYAIEAYVKYGTVTSACRMVGIGRRTWYECKNTDPEFKAQVDEASEDVSDGLEQEAIKRAKDGSDTLLMFLLRGHKPEKYKERRETTNTIANFTPQDREGACLYELSVEEYVNRKAAGTLPPVPDWPENVSTIN